MIINVRLFASLRERVGSDSVEIELAPEATVDDAMEALARRPGLGELLGRMPVVMAVNRGYADRDTPLAPGDEVALVPPVSGGSDLHVRVSEEPLSVDALARGVSRPGAGAIVTFQGTTREVSRLEYEAYVEMAEERIAAILADCCERHGLLAAAAEHRVGRVGLGEPGVVVAVSAGHRGEAFEGAREAIDRIKAEAPIWKRELDAAGEGTWVPGAPAPEPEASR